MLGKTFYKNFAKKGVIYDVQERGITANEREVLLSLFERLIKSIGLTIAREARINTSDAKPAREQGCGDFELVMRRMLEVGSNVWEGEFTKGDKHLYVMGILEDPDQE